jgi:hypothetical protein
VQDEVVGATGNRDWVELDRAETTEDLEHGVLSCLERARWAKRVARDEETPGGLGRDLHGEDGIQWQSVHDRAEYDRQLEHGAPERE